MAKRYEVTVMTRGVNQLMSWMARRDRGPSQVLVTTGRRSGEPHSVPVSPIIDSDVEYIVSPYGERAWVKNVRADPAAALERGGSRRIVTLHEVTGEVPAVVKAYYEREKFARPYMDVPESPTVEDFAAAAARFPVFRVDTA